jgi:hypothetical protein
MIQCDGENSDPYADKRDALRDALALAQLDGKNGRHAAVIVQGDDKIFRPEWNSSERVHAPPLAP